MIGHRQAVLGMSEVENPWFSRDHPESVGNPKMVKAWVNVRGSAIALLASRKVISESQKRAADRFSQEWEAMYCVGSSMLGELTGSSHRPRQGGHRQAEAWSELMRCRQVLGVRGYTLVRQVCGEGYQLIELYPGKRARLTATDNLRADLDTLAGMWGIG